MKIAPTRFLFMAAALIAAPAADAGIIWSDDFTGQAAGAFPNRDFLIDGTNDYAASSNSAYFTVNSGSGSPAPSLSLLDPSTTAGGIMVLRMTSFAPFSTSDATPILKVSFDFRVDSFLSTASNEAFRFILRANNSSAAGDQLVIAFNRGDLDDGDPSTEDLTLSIGSPNGTSNFAASNGSAVGLVPGSGWLPGFDFGDYNSGDGAANDTNGAFYNISFSYDFLSGAVDGLVTRIASDATNGQSASFSRSLNPRRVFSNTDTNDQILLASTNTTVGEARFDNFVFEVVPEPSVAGGLFLGLVALGSRRRRKAD